MFDIDFFLITEYPRELASNPPLSEYGVPPTPVIGIRLHQDSSKATPLPLLHGPPKTPDFPTTDTYVPSEGHPTIEQQNPHITQLLVESKAPVLVSTLQSIAEKSEIPSLKIVTLTGNTPALALPISILSPDTTNPIFAALPQTPFRSFIKEDPAVVDSQKSNETIIKLSRFSKTSLIPVSEKPESQQLTSQEEAIQESSILQESSDTTNPIFSALPQTPFRSSKEDPAVVDFQKSNKTIIKLSRFYKTSLIPVSEKPESLQLTSQVLLPTLPSRLPDPAEKPRLLSPEFYDQFNISDRADSITREVLLTKLPAGLPMLPDKPEITPLVLAKEQTQGSSTILELSPLASALLQHQIIAASPPRAENVILLQESSPKSDRPEMPALLPTLPSALPSLPETPETQGITINQEPPIASNCKLPHIINELPQPAPLLALSLLNTLELPSEKPHQFNILEEVDVVNKPSGLSSNKEATSAELPNHIHGEILDTHLTTKMPMETIKPTDFPITFDRITPDVLLASLPLELQTLLEKPEVSSLRLSEVKTQGLYPTAGQTQGLLTISEEPTLTPILSLPENTETLSGNSETDLLSIPEKVLEVTKPVLSANKGELTLSTHGVPEEVLPELLQGIPRLPKKPEITPPGLRIPEKLLEVTKLMAVLSANKEETKVEPTPVTFQAPQMVFSRLPLGLPTLPKKPEITLPGLNIPERILEVTKPTIVLPPNKDDSIEELTLSSFQAPEMVLTELALGLPTITSDVTSPNKKETTEELPNSVFEALELVLAESPSGLSTITAPKDVMSHNKLETIGAYEFPKVMLPESTVGLPTVPKKPELSPSQNQLQESIIISEQPTHIEVAITNKQQTIGGQSTYGAPLPTEPKLTPNLLAIPMEFINTSRPKPDIIFDPHLSTKKIRSTGPLSFDPRKREVQPLISNFQEPVTSYGTPVLPDVDETSIPGLEHVEPNYIPINFTDQGLPHGSSVNFKKQAVKLPPGVLTKEMIGPYPIEIASNYYGVTMMNPMLMFSQITEQSP